jgi:hypothetical protein
MAALRTDQLVDIFVLEMLIILLQAIELIVPDLLLCHLSPAEETFPVSIHPIS